MSSGGMTNRPETTVNETDGSIGVRGLVALHALRRLVFKGIAAQHRRGEYGKAYDGQLTIEAPSFGEASGTGAFWIVELHSYVFGPGRHYRWTGNSLQAACELAVEHVTEWLLEDAREAGEIPPAPTPAPAPADDTGEESPF